MRILFTTKILSIAAIILSLQARAQSDEFIVNGVSFKMVFVEGGTFVMGATNEQNSNVTDDEKPVHKVTINSYYIGQTEVTQALWKAVMGDNPSHFSDNLQCPVEQVDWNDCQEFIVKLNQLTGKNFRLPTEAEWEFAARGGTKSKDYKYSGSNILNDVAWYYENSGISKLQDALWSGDSIVPNKCRTHPVGIKNANELGLYDLTGNVCEWCADWYGVYSHTEQINPIGPNNGSKRVLRGGGWCYPASFCRVSCRFKDIPEDEEKFAGFGLRLAHSK